MQEKLKERVDPTKTALVIVDVQNDFAHPEGAFGKRGHDMSRMTEMVPRLQKLIDAAHRASVSVIFIHTIHDRWTDSESWVSRKDNVGEMAVCREGTWGTEFYKVSPDIQDFVVTKRRYSAFQDTELDLVLRSIGVRNIICTGIATNVCVESTARQGYMLDYHLVFVDDCSATTSQREHDATLENMRNFFGLVATADEIIEAWE